MCTLAFAYKQHKDYPLIFLGNRDEFFKRPTLDAHVHDGIISGIDLEKGGTWTGVSQNGRIAFLTNHRNFALHVENPKSRGHLTKDFLEGDEAPLDYLERIKASHSAFDPFNLVVGDLHGLYYYSNVRDRIEALAPGIYGLSNAHLDTPWPKTVALKEGLTKLITHNQLNTDDFFLLLESKAIAPDEALPATGLSLELERQLSSVFIDLPEYGTRYETVILIAADDKINFYEKARQPDHTWRYQSLEIRLTKLLNRMEIAR